MEKPSHKMFLIYYGFLPVPAAAGPNDRDDLAV